MKIWKYIYSLERAEYLMYEEDSIRNKELGLSKGRPDHKN